MIILNILEIVAALILIVLVLLQAQGGGLSSTFGGSGEIYRSKRSVEKFMVWATVGVTVAFALISILLLIPTK